jgi:excisionase family DNA binding protein
MIATFPKQTRFNLPIADDVRLVTVETARACRGLTAESIIELAEDAMSADHLQAFDFNLGDKGEVRDLRLWAGNLRNSSIADLESIIADCLLTNLQGLANREINVNSSQLERAWCVSNQKILRLIASAEIKGVRVGRNWRVNRASAAEFLRRRAL